MPYLPACILPATAASTVQVNPQAMAARRGKRRQEYCQVLSSDQVHLTCEVPELLPKSSTSDSHHFFSGGTHIGMCQLPESTKHINQAIAQQCSSQSKIFTHQSTYSYPYIVLFS